VVTASPSRSVAPGTLEESPSIVNLPSPSPVFATFTLTAQGGPVTFSIAAPGEPSLTITPTTGTLQAGQQVQVTVSVSASANPQPHFPTVEVEPGNIVVTIYYRPTM
jgi:hypothetical protein